MKKFTVFILWIVVILLIAIIGIFGTTIYLNMIEDVPNEISYSANELTNISEEENRDKSSKLIEFKNKINLFIQNIFNNNEDENIESQDYEIQELNENYFYNQLDDNQKKIYCALQQNKENLMYGNYEIKFGDSFSDLLNQENGSDILGNNYQTAIEAFTHDNPDLFYIDVNKMYINIETTTKLMGITYNVFIGPEENTNYFSDGFTSYDGVIVAKNAIETIRDEILKNVTGTTYQKVKIIHDYLTNSIEYDSDYKSNGKYSLYGAFIDKLCVCEGYAKAFKYLTNAAGINCEILQGESTNSSGNTESHAWNCVEVGNVWYEIDVTWDDPIVIGNGKLSNKSKYKYFLKGTKTFENDHKIYRQFTDGGKIFIYPDISTSDYE